MSRKTEKERHNLAMTISFLITGVVVFFVLSSWYFRISGDSYDTSFFTDIEGLYKTQSENFIEIRNDVNKDREQISNIISGFASTSASTTISQ